MYKKEYNQVFESNDEDWRKKHDYKNLKGLDYQSDKADDQDEEDEIEYEEDETEAEETISERLNVSKNRFDRIRSMVTRYVDDGLHTTVDNKKITLKNAKKLLQDIGSGRIDRDGEM